MKPKDIAKTYPVAIGSAIGILIFAGLAFWRSSAFDDLQATLSAHQQESEELTSNVHNSAKLSAQLEQLGRMNDTIQSRLTNPNDLAGNQQYFYKLEADNKVKLSDLKQSIQPHSAKKKAFAFYSTVSYSLRVQGDYTHVMQFLRSIESGSRLAVIDGASLDLGTALKKDEDITDSTPLTLSLNLQFLGTL